MNQASDKKEILEAINGLAGKFDNLSAKTDRQISEIKADHHELLEVINCFSTKIEGRISGVESEIKDLRGGFKDLKSEFKDLKGAVNTQMVTKDYLDTKEIMSMEPFPQLAL